MRKEEESKKYGTQVVKDLFQRRNDIAHQNDRSHASAEQTDITKEFVEDYIGKIEKNRKCNSGNCCSEGYTSIECCAIYAICFSEVSQRHRYSDLHTVLP